MDISAAGARSTSRSRTARAQRGDVAIVRVDVPEEIPVGQEETVIIGVEAVGQVDVFDPDHCVAADLGAGIRTDVEVTVGPNRIASDTFCIPTGRVGTPGEREMQFGLRGDEAGPVDLTVTAFGRGSDNRLDERTFTIDVVGEPTNGGDGGVSPTNGEDGTGPLLPCFLDPNRKCSRPESLAWAGLAVLLITQVGED